MKKKGRYSKFIIALIITLNVIFTAAVLYINYLGYAVSDSLIISWFGFTSGEAGLLAIIKVFKLKKGDKQDELPSTISDEE